MDWIKIFESSSAADTALSENKPRLLLIRGKKICLVKREGKIFATQDNCTHSGGSLSMGTVNYNGEVVCPVHQYQFNIKTGRESGERSRDLECYPIRENEEGVFISI